MLINFNSLSFQRFSTLQMESMAYIFHESPIAGSEFYTEGDLKLKQKYLLPNKGRYTTYNVRISFLFFNIYIYYYLWPLYWCEIYIWFLLFILLLLLYITITLSYQYKATCCPTRCRTNVCILGPYFIVSVTSNMWTVYSPREGGLSPRSTGIFSL